MTGSSGVWGAVGRAGASVPGPELCPQILSLFLQDSGPNKVSSASPVLGEGLSLWWGRGRPWEPSTQQPCSELGRAHEWRAGCGVDERLQ